MGYASSSNMCEITSLLVTMPTNLSLNTTGTLRNLFFIRHEHSAVSDSVASIVTTSFVMKSSTRISSLLVVCELSFTRMANESTSFSEIIPMT